MNSLLPKIDELTPIKKDTDTFYDCDFSEDFNKLPFINKLQVINDIVRQSMIPVVNSNPENDVDNMMGNCHTASLLSISYLKSLGIGKNHRYVLCTRRPFDPKDLFSKHALVLVDDENGNTYEFDATPFSGYGFGTVKKLDNNPLYEDYIPITGEVEYLIKMVRTFMYEKSSGTLTQDKLPFYEYIFELCAIKPFLRGFAAYGYKLLYNSKFKSDAYLKRVIQLEPYAVINPDQDKRLYRQSLLNDAIKLWQEEMLSLGNKPQDLKRKLELGTMIVQEQKRFNPALERWLQYKGENIPYSYLTPRFFYEEDLNVVIIKASAYHVGLRGTIREAFLKRGNGAIGEYFTNLAQPTADTGLKPVLYTHTLGDRYERSMNGMADIFAIQKPSDELYKKKHELRSSLAQNICLRDVMWNDGETIFWHPFVTNLVHTTDNPSEASLHFLSGFPEHQAMTRFMYPNPKLERKLKK